MSNENKKSAPAPGKKIVFSLDDLPTPTQKIPLPKGIKPPKQEDKKVSGE